MGWCCQLELAAFNMLALFLLLPTFSLNKHLKRGKLSRRNKCSLIPKKSHFWSFQPIKIEAGWCHIWDSMLPGRLRRMKKDTCKSYAVAAFFPSNLQRLRAKLDSILWISQPDQPDQDVSGVQSKEAPDSRTKPCPHFRFFHGQAIWVWTHHFIP